MRVIFLYCTFLFSLTACSLQAALLSSLLPATLKTAVVQEKSLSSVQIKLIGTCDDSASSHSLSFQDKEFLAEPEENVSIECRDSKLTAFVQVSDPNVSKTFHFILHSLKGSQGIPSNVLEYTYIRPKVPAPVSDFDEILTKEPSPVLSGICLQDRVEHLEFRLDGGAWAQIVCSGDIWQWTPSSPYANEVEETHLFEIRAVNTSHDSPFSEVTPISLRIDTLPPQRPLVPPDSDVTSLPTWTWASGGGGNGSFRFTIDEANMEAGVQTSLMSHLQMQALSFGSHVFRVQERDDAGNWSAIALRNVTVKCPEGSFFDGSLCPPCPLGTYQSELNLASSCVAAPSGFYVSTEGATAPLACTNKPGNALDVIYNSSSGLTANICPIQSVSSCEFGYLLEMNSCRRALIDPVSFFPAENVDPKVTVTSNAVSLNGFEGSLSLTCLGCSDIEVNGVLQGSPSVTIGVGDVIRLLVLSGEDFDQTVVAHLTAGLSAPIYWSVTTRNSSPCLGTLWGNLTHNQSVTAYQDMKPTGNCVSESRICKDGVLSGSFSEITCLHGCSLPWGGQVVDGTPVTAYSSSSVTYTVGMCSSMTRTCSNGVLSGNSSYAYNSCSVDAPRSCSLDGQPVSHGGSIAAYLASSVPFGDSCISTTRTCFDNVLDGSNSYAHASCTVMPQGCTFNGSPVSHGASVVAYQSSQPAGACVSENRTCNNGSLSGSFSAASCASGCSLPWGGQVVDGTPVTAYNSSSVSYSVGSCSAITRTCSNGFLGGNGSYTYGSCSVDAPRSCNLDGQFVSHGGSIAAYATSTVPFGSSCVPSTRTCNDGSLSGSGSYASCSVSGPSNCTFNGNPVADGSSVVAYQSSLPNGSCVSESRTCNNGSLSGSYGAASCTPCSNADNTSNMCPGRSWYMATSYIDSDTCPGDMNCSTVAAQCRSGSNYESAACSSSYNGMLDKWMHTKTCTCN